MIILGIAFLETSALQSVNIDKAFMIMVQEIFNKYHKQLEDEDDETEIGGGKGIDLGKKTEPEKKKKECC